MALMAEKGVDIQKFKQKKKEKAARKEKAKKAERKAAQEEDNWEDASNDSEGGVPVDGFESEDEELETSKLGEVGSCLLFAKWHSLC